jgi:molecular chaperone GrpE
MKEEKKEKEEEDKNLKTGETGETEKTGDVKEGKNVEEFEKNFNECQIQKEKYLVGWQRAQADFMNYKKEEMEKIGALLNYNNEELILKILPILDNFYLVEKNLPESLKNNEYIKGIFQIKKQLEEFLKNQGAEELEVKIGEKFDPNFQESVEEVKIENKESDIIVEEVQKGYKIQGRLLRPAKVKISK